MILSIPSHNPQDFHMKAGSVKFSKQLVDASTNIIHRIGIANRARVDGLSISLTTEPSFLDRLSLILRTRAAHHTACQIRSAELERSRSDSIARIRRERDYAFATKLRQARVHCELERKKRMFRISAKKHEILDRYAGALLAQNNRRLNAMRQEAIRERGIALRVAVREQRVKEAKWMEEHMGDDLQQSILTITDSRPTCSLSAVESVKTFKTGTSSSQLANLKSQENLLQKKAEFLEKVERNDRLRSKLEKKLGVSRPRSGTELEIEKIVKWRTERHLYHEKLLKAKLAKLAHRHEDVLLARTQSLAVSNNHKSLQDVREVHWREAEINANRSAINRAIERGCSIDSLITCLRI